jgi:hypothetical protein
MSTRSKLSVAAVRGWSDKEQDAPESAEHRVIPVTIARLGGSAIKAEAMIDCGGTEEAFMDRRFAAQRKMQLLPLRKPRVLELADGRLVDRMTHLAIFNLEVGEGHVEQILAYVTDLAEYGVILGRPWLNKHDPTIRWSADRITFDSGYCLHHCLKYNLPTTVYGRVGCPISDSQEKEKRAKRRSDKEQVKPDRRGAFDVFGVSAAYFMKVARKVGAQLAALWPEDWDRVDAPPTEDMTAAKVCAVTASDWDKFMRAKKEYTRQEIEEKLPEQLRQYAWVFEKNRADSLPPHRNSDFEIKLKDGANPPYRKAYPMARDELQAVRKYIEEHLAKGFIRPSTSSVASPVLLVKKPGGGLRFCVDYRSLNALTVKNRYPIPLIRETLDRLCKSQWFTKIDIVAAFSRVRIKEGHQHLTAFISSLGLYEYEVMPFGVCNGPGTFQGLINEVLRELLEDCVSVYLDDILVYSSGTIEEHWAKVAKVLSLLGDSKLFADIDKYDFGVKEVKYLGLIISVDGIKMDPSKVSTIRDWATPRSAHNVLAFLGFAGFYRRFIKGFSPIAAPLTNLTKGYKKGKKNPFDWTPECNKAFTTLRDAFKEGSMLAHFDPLKETWVETDVSDYAVGGVLSQCDADGVLRPVAFFSHKFSPAECNYKIYDKELLAIIKAFKEWRPELAGTNRDEPIKVLSDHRALEYFASKRTLNRRQARWSEFLAEFNFKIQYRPGLQGTKPDALTRRPGDIPMSASDKRVLHQRQILLKPDQMPESEVIRAQHSRTSEGGTLLACRLAVALTDEADSAFKLNQAYENSELAKAVIAAKQGSTPDINKADFTASFLKHPLDKLKLVGNRIYVDDRLWIPPDKPYRLDLMQQAHSSLLGGHGGRASTYNLLRRHYFWAAMQEDVESFVENCTHCHRMKIRKEKKKGLLRTLPVPERSFEDITMDFVVDLPPSKSAYDGVTYKNVLVVVDRLSKRRKFIEMNSMKATDVANAFVRRVFPDWGFPKSIVSDLGKQFLAKFWLRICQRLGARPQLSTAHHPESDGQTEIANGFLEQYLRCFCEFDQGDWVNLLPMAEFFANNKESSTTGLTPFFATYGFHPRSGIEPPTPPEGKETAKDRVARISADATVERWEKLWDFLKEQSIWAKERMTHFANLKRQDHPKYSVGDRVYLDTRFLRSLRLSKKLDQKHAGPYPITRVVHGGNAYELKLPHELKGLNAVFHPWLLHREATREPYPGQEEVPEPPLMVEREGETPARGVRG